MANILLIDDESDLTDFLGDDLRKHGHRVTCLERAEHALEELQNDAFDVVLLDNMMPRISGIEFLGALKEHGLDVPVILMTSYGTTESVIQAMNLGAFDYVTKPATYQALFGKLEPILRKALAIARPGPKVRLPGDDAPAQAAGVMMVSMSPSMLAVYKSIGQFASYDCAVLIRGETGTGKELVARAIHTHSPRQSRPFVALNCTALSEQLLEDELFGHEPGAFTGADKLRKGIFEYAHGGTLFLDEIGDMPLPLQAKLLRVLEYQEVRRLGSNEAIKVNVRLLSATHRDLEAAIHAGQFRSDLFYRLNGVTIRLPPLRERRDDLPDLCTYFLARAAEEMGRPSPALAETTLDKLRGYHWPGNVRELRNVLYRAVVVCGGRQVLPADVDLPTNATAAQGEVVAGLRQAIRCAWNSNEPKLWPRLRDLLERELLQFALGELKDNQTEVAERLGMARGTLIKRIGEYGIKRNG